MQKIGCSTKAELWTSFKWTGLSKTKTPAFNRKKSGHWRFRNRNFPSGAVFMIKLEFFSEKTFEKGFPSAPLSARKLWRSLRPKPENFPIPFKKKKRRAQNLKKCGKILGFGVPRIRNGGKRGYGFNSFYIFGRPWPKPTHSRTAGGSSHKKTRGSF